MWTREQLKTNGKMAFHRNYWECVAVSLVMGLFTGAVNVGSARNEMDYHKRYFGDGGGTYIEPLEAGRIFSMALIAVSAFSLVLALAAIFLKIFVGNALTVGGSRFFIENRTGNGGFGTVASSFRSGCYGNITLTMFLMDLYVFLWSLLLLIPGIIKSYEYLMVPYILAENPQMDQREIFAISKRMMDGEKMNAFILDLSFIGWMFLVVFTCGIAGIFYVQPYITATRTELYAYNKVKAYNEGYIR